MTGELYRPQHSFLVWMKSRSKKKSWFPFHICLHCPFHLKKLCPTTHMLTSPSKLGSGIQSWGGGVVWVSLFIVSLPPPHHSITLASSMYQTVKEAIIPRASDRWDRSNLDWLKDKQSYFLIWGWGVKSNSSRRRLLVRSWLTSRYI